MLVPLPDAANAKALATLRELLAQIDPEARVRVDEVSGDVLVKGQFSAQQLSTVIERSGLRARVTHAGGNGCCGGCGCG